MTAIKPSSDLDRFGLGPDLGAPNPKSSLQGEHWVPIRDLHARHRPRILDHLLHLDERDRYLRFGFPATQHQMTQYVASIDFKRDEVFGIFDRKLRLVAVAHLAALPGHGPHEAHPDTPAWELGVAGLPAAGTRRLASAYRSARQWPGRVAEKAAHAALARQL